MCLQCTPNTAPQQQHTYNNHMIPCVFTLGSLNVTYDVRLYNTHFKNYEY